MTTVLIVDDEYDIRFLYQEELESEGYKVLTADSGEEALGILSTQTPDIITLDLKMPSMSGVDLLRKMKEIKPEIPVIVVTAFDYSHYETQNMPCEGYLVKSSDLGELKKMITKTLKTKTKKT
jgi:DNA-binding response OmpR family regulator